MREPPQWPACAYLSPFTCVLMIEPPEHIMRAPVAAQGGEWARAVAKKPHSILGRFHKALSWLDFPKGRSDHADASPPKSGRSPSELGHRRYSLRVPE